MNMSRVTLPLILLQATSYSGFSLAQAVDEASSNVERRIEEVVVSATRRDTNLQTTPISVSVIGEDQIAKTSPRDIGDLAVFAPNFSAARVTSFANAASFAMRGVGQNNIIVYFESPVAVLVDDFVVTSVQSQLLDTFDIEQVEVLRGPQGTLFGKNATGGAVSVKTKRPNLEEMEGAVQVGTGSYGSQWYKGALNVPVVPGNLAIRAVGSYEKSDGYMRNGAEFGPISGFVPSKFNGLSGQGSGEETGGQDVVNGRVKVSWEPSSEFRALLQYEVVRDDTEFEATVNETPVGTGFLFDLLGLGASAGGDPHNKAGTSNRSDLLIGLPDSRVDIDGYFLNMDLDLSRGTLTSITGFREQKSRLSGAETGNAPVIASDGEFLSPFDINRADDRETFQQELRFTSDFAGPFNFVAGVFYQEEDIDFCVAQVLGFLDLIGAPTGGFSFFGTDYGTFNQNAYVLCSAQESENRSAYAEGTFDVSEKLSLTAGFRYTEEKKTFRARQQIFVQELGGFSDPDFTWENLGGALQASVNNFPFGVVEDSDVQEEPTWRLSSSYQLTDDIFTYATYSRGFKSGGYNDQIGNSGAFGNDLDAFLVAAQPTKPETADSFEIGVKVDAFDGKMRLNVTGFFVQYDDLQRQINIPIEVNGVPQQVTQFFNAAKAEVTGLEAEASALLSENWTLRGVFGYQDCEIKEFEAPGAGYDLTEAPCERAPELQWTVDATYETQIDERFNLAINAHVNYTDESLYTQSIESKEFNTFLEERTLVNASITLSDRDDRYYARIIGKNLTDKRYKVASQVVAGLWTFTNYAPPRYYGFELGFNW